MRLSELASLPKRRWGRTTAYSLTALGFVALAAAQALEQPNAPSRGASLNAHSIQLPFGLNVPSDSFR